MQASFTRFSFFLLLIFFGAPLSISAQNLLSWEFQGNAGDEPTVTADVFATGISATAPSGVISRGAGLGAAGNGNRFNGTNWQMGATVDITNDKYMTFSITPDAGYEMSLSAIVFNWEKSNTGPSSVVFTSSLDGHSSVIGTPFTGLTNTGNNGLTLTLPAAFQNLVTGVTFRAYGYGYVGTFTNGTGGFEGTGNDLIVQGTASVATGESVTTGTVSPVGFCVAGGNPATVSVPYTVTGTFLPGNIFGAVLSDANGDFTSPTLIGTEVSTGSGTINAIIPGTTPPGSGYRILVGASNPITLGTDNGVDLTVSDAVPAVTGLVAQAGNQSLTLDWTASAGCNNQVVVIIREGAAVSADISQANLDGLIDTTDYVENAAWDLRSLANDMYDISANLLGNVGESYVVLSAPSTTETLTVTGLSNDVEYYFRVFLIEGLNSYGPAVDLSATPRDFCARSMLITEYLEGASFDKCLEIYNADSIDLNLSNYQINLYINGSPTPAQGTALANVVLAPGDVYVLCNGQANATLLALADQTYFNINYNGNDAIAIHCPATGTNLDVFGKIGDDPGNAGWIGSVSGCGTADQIWRRNPFLGSPLTGLEPTFDPDNLYICGGNFTDYSDLGSFSATFPVELASFGATWQGVDALIRWETATELSNDRFELYRLADGEPAELVAQVAGAGFADQAISYQWIDPQPGYEVMVYQLFQIDFDGTKRMIGVAELRQDVAPAFDLSLSANPVTTDLGFSWRSAHDAPLRYQVIDLHGRTLTQGEVQDAPQRTQHLSVESLTSGVYLLQVSQAGVQRQLRFVKQ